MKQPSPCACRLLAGLCAAALLMPLSGCGEKSQDLGTSRKADSAPWSSTPTAFTAPGWSGGDKAAWEAQMRTRSQGQNEYSRSAAQP